MGFNLQNWFSDNAAKFQVNVTGSFGDIHILVKVARQDRHRYHTRVYNPNTWAKMTALTKMPEKGVLKICIMYVRSRGEFLFLHIPAILIS